MPFFTAKYLKKSKCLHKGGAGDREKMPVNHEAFLLMANSQNDMEDWVKAIRRVIWAPFGGGIFGQRLEDTVQYERKYGHRLAPLLVEQCVDFIRERGLTEEGLFRMPGQANLVKDLQDSFDCGEKPLFDSTTDVHTVASLLKLYLRELPEPVIPFAKYEDFLSCAQLLSKDESEGTLELAKQVKNLPQANYNLLKYICKFLDEVQAHSNINKMSVQNLATVFGPNILRPKKEDPVTIMEGTSLVQHLMTILISKHSQLFSATHSDAPSDAPNDAPVPKPEVKSTVPRSAAEWILEEHVEEGWKETNLSGVTDGPSKRTGSLDSATVGTLPKPTQERISRRTQTCPNKTTTSPSKKVQTLPNWKYSFRQPGTKSGSPKLVSSSLDINSLPSSGNWLMNGLSSLRGHRRTSSGDRAKDSNLPQRLSTYDNVPSGSPSMSTHSVASMAWSTSSCEISVVDSVSNCPVCHASGSSPCSLARFEWPPRGSPAASSDIKPAELGDSSERLAVCVSTLNGSGSEGHNFNSMSRDSAQCSHALQSLVTELKAELNKQRTEYETSLRRIEEASSGLKKQMARLEEDLDQERKKFTMLEIRLRNSERAREDAEKRNQLLQKEMEEFFSTLGTLTLGSRGTKVPK